MTLSIGNPFTSAFFTIVQASNVTSYVLLADTEDKEPNNTTANKNFIIDPKR
jgi:hypothetical protein